VQKEEVLTPQKPELQKTVRSLRSDPVVPSPLEAKQEEVSPAKEKVVTPEADMFVSALEADEKDVAIKSQTIEPVDSAPEPKYDENAIDKNLVSLNDPQSYEAEQFKILRTNLLYPVSGTPPQSILITSSMPGEGKSFVSANLAISIALNVNKHVLLIDCDLRKPDIHHRFGFGNVGGLSDYLSDHTDLASLLLKTGVDKLTLLPGGSTPPNPSELMSSEKMTELLEEVKYRYHDRLIVIDSPPPSMAAETSFLARQVDGIIVVAKHGHTPRQELEDLIDRMGSKKILGTVVNFMDSRLRYYGYKKYGQYGRRYEYGKRNTNKNA
jgi:protein-tyrosine kinase